MGLFFLNVLHDADHFKGGWKALFVKFLVTHHGSSLLFFFFFLEVMDFHFENFLLTVIKLHVL